MNNNDHPQSSDEALPDEPTQTFDPAWHTLIANSQWRQLGRQLYQRSMAQLTWLLSLSIPRTALIITAVSVFDWLTPLGISGGVLYMAAVLSAVPIRHRWAIFITGGLCCVLVLVGWAISPGRGDTELWKVLINRILALGVIGAAMGMSESWRRLQERRAKQLQESRLLHQVTALAAFEGSFHEALQNSVKVLCDIFGWPAAHVYLKESEGGHLASTETWNLPEDGRFSLLKTATMGVRFAPGEGAAGYVWQSGKAIAVADVSQSPYYQWLNEPQRLGVRGAFAFPLIVGGDVAAVVEFFSEHEIHLDPEFFVLASNIGQQLGRLFERRRADLALRKSEERLRLALTGGQMGTWEWQIESGRLIWSPELERMHGLEPGTFADSFEAFEEAVHPEDRRRVSDSIRRAVETHEEFHCEYRMLRPDGEVQWFEGRGAVQIGADGQVRRMVGVCMDITQRKQVEVETRRAKETAEAANRLRSQFLANISHELRTPMSAILGMLHLSLEENGLPEHLRENLETAKRSADSLLVLLNDVLDFSRIEGNGLRIGRSQFDLRKLMDDTIRPLATRAFEDGLELIYDVAADVPNHLVGDADRLRQVLMNLAVNAIKFTEHGDVVVEVKLQQQLPGEARIQFSVRDTGVGISEEDQQRIFEPFVQADASTTRSHGGVGLGLSISSELVRLMGGRLEVESEFGKGSRFYFSLTLNIVSDADDDALRSPDTRNLQSLPVLVVDDNATCRTLLVETLRRWSMQPEGAIDADHALGKLYRAEAEGRQYSLIVADADMSGMPGEELLRRTEEDFERPPPVILMCTGHDRHADQESNRQSPFAAQVEKPISPSMLLDAIMTVLNLDAPHSFSAPPESSGEPATKQLSVLLVEDTSANQKVVGNVLRKRSHQVAVAAHGKEAIQMLRGGERFDVILMDVQMPVMDGYEATAEVRKLELDSGRRTPIVAMTAHAMEGDRERCLAAGMDTYLTKPIDVQRLIEVVEGITSTDGHGRAPPARGVTHGAVDSRTIDFDATLSRLAGDRELLAEFIAVFQEDAPGLIQSLDAAISSGDAAALERAAHSLKGLAANIGAVAVAQSAGELERIAATASPDKLAGVLARIRRQKQQVDDTLAGVRVSAM